MVSGRYKNDNLIGSQKFCKSILRCYFATLGWHDIIKVSLLDELENDVETSLKHTLYVYLRECWPLGVEFKPLAYTLIVHDIKSLDIAVFTRAQGRDQALGEFAVGSVQRALNKHHAGVILHQVVDFSESKLFFLFEQSLDVFVHLCDLLGQLIGGYTSYHSRVLLVRHHQNERGHTFDIEMIDEIFS